MCAQTAPNPSAGILLVANKGDNSVGIIDPVAGKQVAEVAEGGVTGHEIAASPDGRLAYVPIYGNSGVGQPGTDGSNMVVIDLAARKVTGNVDFGNSAVQGIITTTAGVNSAGILGGWATYQGVDWATTRLTISARKEAVRIRDRTRQKPQRDYRRDGKRSYHTISLYFTGNGCYLTLAEPQ